MSLSNQDHHIASSLNQTSQVNSDLNANDQSSMDKSLEMIFKDLDNKGIDQIPEKLLQERFSNQQGHEILVFDKEQIDLEEKSQLITDSVSLLHQSMIANQNEQLTLNSNHGEQKPVSQELSPDKRVQKNEQNWDFSQEQINQSSIQNGNLISQKTQLITQKPQITILFKQQCTQQNQTSEELTHPSNQSSIALEKLQNLLKSISMVKQGQQSLGQIKFKAETSILSKQNQPNQNIFSPNIDETVENSNIEDLSLEKWVPYNQLDEANQTMVKFSPKDQSIEEIDEQKQQKFMMETLNNLTQETTIYKRQIESLVIQSKEFHPNLINFLKTYINNGLGQTLFKVASNLAKIANKFLAFGYYKNGLKFYQKCYDLQMDIYSLDSDEVSITLNNIALCYSLTGNYKKALQIYNKCRKVIEENYGKQSLELTKVLVNEASVKQKMENFDEALQIYEKILEIRKKIKQLKQTDLANIFSKIGNIHNKKGNHEKALDNENISLEIRTRVFGPESIDVAGNFNSIGIVYYDKGDYVKALENFNKCLKIRTKIYGPESIHVAAILNNIGGVYNSKGDYLKALENFNKSLEIATRVFGPESIQVADNLRNIGFLYEKKGNYENALDNYNKCLQIRTRVLGPESNQLAEIFRNIGLVYEKKGDKVKALNNYKKCLKIRSIVLGPGSIPAKYLN